MFNTIVTRAALPAATVVLLAFGFGATNADEHGQASMADYTKMSSDELAEYLIFETNSFKLDQPVQEGGVAGDRLKQDDIQKLMETGLPNILAVSPAGKLTITWGSIKK